MENKLEVIYAVAAVRVSTDKQGLVGDSPEDQRKQVENRIEQLSSVLGIKIVIKQWFSFTESASGSLDMQPVQKTIEFCKDESNKIKYFFFKSIDRFTRGGSTIYGLLRMQLARYGVQPVDIYGVISQQEVNTLDHLKVEYSWSKFNPSWTTELLEAERAKGEVRDILTRMIGAEINYVRLGYSVRPPEFGYKNIKVETPHGLRTIRALHEVESPWIIRIFELRVRGDLTDEEIVKEINLLGYKSRRIKVHDSEDRKKIIGYKGEKPLTVKQLQRIVQKPIYAGINTEKWTDGQPIKEKFPGLILIEQFNQANRGKVVIVEEGEMVRIYKDKPADWLLKKNKDNPLYAYKKQVLCPICRSPLLGSASRSKSGKHIPRYHCSRGHKHWSINKEKFSETIRDFVEPVKFSEEFRQRFREIVLEEWEKRKEQVSKDSISAEERVLRLKYEEKLVTEKIKMLNSELALRAMETELERIEQEKALAMQHRDIKEDEEIDIQAVINYCLYFMEHPKEVILGGTNELQNAAMFGLLFDEPPTFEELKNGTPKLAPIFALNSEFETYQSLSVTPRGLEPLCLG